MNGVLPVKAIQGIEHSNAANKEKAPQLSSMHTDNAKRSKRLQLPIRRPNPGRRRILRLRREWARPKWKLKSAFPTESSGSSLAGAG